MRGALASTFKLEINHPRITSQPTGAAYLTITSSDYREFLRSLGYSWGKRSAESASLI